MNDIIRHHNERKIITAFRFSIEHALKINKKKMYDFVR